MVVHTDQTTKTDSSKTPDSRSPVQAKQTGISVAGPAAVAHQSLENLASQSQRVTQLKAYQTMADRAVVQRQANTTGLPDNLKSGIENLSGYSMNDVKVHNNSSQPAQLNAHAFAQGNQIHLASGQEKNLPHEAWHVVQQKQGRVQPTKQLKGKVAINDDAGLEQEADVMGAKGLQMKEKLPTEKSLTVTNSNEVTQLARDPNLLETKIVNDTLNRPELSGKAEGFGAMVGAKKWVTKLRWGGLNANAGEGTSMVAEPLGPDHPSGKDSTKSGPESQARAQFLSRITGTPYIRGHLLNDNLGGSAETRNLTAIPSKPGNSAHSSAVEEPIKAEIDKRNWVYYSVDVAYETKRLEEITPIDAEEFNDIKREDYYKNLPGVKPANLSSNFTIASSFTTEWYTYQADGNRHGPVNRITIHFPVHLNNSFTEYKDRHNNYIPDFVTIGATTIAEKATNGTAAKASKASWLNLDKNVMNKVNSVAPDTAARDYEAEAEEDWEEQFGNMVDEDREELRYPDRRDNWRIKTVKIPDNFSRIRQSKGITYMKAYDLDHHNVERIERSWELYKEELKEVYRKKYADEWAAVRDAADETLT